MGEVKESDLESIASLLKELKDQRPHLDTLKKQQGDPTKFAIALDRLKTLVGALGSGSPQTVVTEAPTTTSGSPTPRKDSPSAATSFSGFIQSVGESLSEAQKSLDSQARDALRSRSPNEVPLLPTLYRIPKLSAEVKFAFGEKTDKELNLLFFSKKEQASEEHQQSIAFDIVATPPPPELLERLQRGIPSLQLVLAPSVREEVLDAIQSIRDLQKKQGQTAPTALNELELNFLPKATSAGSTKDRLVIIGVPDPNTRRYLVFAAGKSSAPDQAHEVGVWHVDLTDPKVPGLQAVLRYSSKGDTGEHQGFLREFILDLGKRQAEFLGGLRPA
jgi:hypothetical protein